MAISSPISLLRSTTSQTTKTTKSIQNTLIVGISKKKNLLSSVKIFKNRRRDFERREIQKNVITSPAFLTKSGGAKSLSLSDGGLNITDRLFGFVKYLTAGWILGNLPTWISLGGQFVGRLGTVGSILKNYSDETLNVMKSITGIFDSALKNLSAFDFSDNSGLMESSIDELIKSLDDLGDGLSSALDVLFAPFKNVPPIGEITQEPDAYTDRPQQPPQQSPIDGKNSDFWTLVAVAATEDSDPQGQADVAQSIYNRARAGNFPGRTSIRNIILANRQYQPTRNRPKVNPSGNTNPEWFQIKDAESAAKATGFEVSTIQGVARNIMNPSLQKKAAEFIQNRTDFVGRDMPTPTGSTTDIIQRNPGDNKFGTFVGTGSKTSGTQYKGQPAPVPSSFTQNQSPNQTTPTRPPVQLPSGQRRLGKGDVFTKSLGKGVDYIQITSLVGDWRKHGSHGGIDVAAPSGTYIALRVDCEVVRQGDTGGGYGIRMDIWVPEYGIQLRMAHLSGVIIKSGKIPAGTSFARVGNTGTSSGPHIHLEYDTKKGETRYGGARNDNSNYAAILDQYVRLLLLTKNPNNGKFSPANTKTAPSPNPPKPSIPLVPSTQQPSIPNPEQSVEMQNNDSTMNLLQGIVQERQGRKIVVIDDRSSTGQQMILSGGGGGSYIQMSSEYSMLNTFMKNKLLLDLTYL
ncbi:MAG: peptidoglycan DD-metalloendopeptidase family protein [Methylophilaceae bacterium]